MVLLGGMDRDEGLPVSLRLAMCLAERERDPSGCRASGLTLELPVHVVLVPPPSLDVVDTNFKLWILLLSATALSSRRFFSRFLQHWRHTSADVYPTDTSQWSLTIQ